jgi:hypothetical protein
MRIIKSFKHLSISSTCTCIPSLYMYLLLVQMNNNNVNAHFGYVHHLNNNVHLCSPKNTKSQISSLVTKEYFL